jgi:cytochrome P450
MPSAVRPEYDLDFTDPDINRDPWPHYEPLREMAPAVFNAPSDSWLVASYDDLRAMYTNDVDFGPPAELFEDVVGDPSIIGNDDPRHRELRGIWNPYLVRGAMDRWAGLVGGIIDDQLEPIVDRLRDGEVVDVVSRLRMIPVKGIATMIGVPTEDCDQFSEWGQRIAYQFDAMTVPGSDRAIELRDKAFTASSALHEYCGEQLESRRRSGKADDLLGVLANTDVAMTDDEKSSYVALFIEGAQDTTTKYMTTVLATLAEYPDVRKAVKAARDLMPKVLEEIMRWRTTVSTDVRIARGPDVRVGEVRIPDGDTISLLLGAANRDPSRWTDPDTFDIYRPAQSHLGFGFGIHSCMGVNLARLEAATLVNKVLDAVPEYQLAVDELDYGRSFAVRGPVSLPLSL